MSWEMQRRGEYAEPKVAARLIIGSTQLAAKAASIGAGIAYVEAREAEHYLGEGTLVQILKDWTPPLDSEALYYPPNRLKSAAFKAFIAFVRANRLW